MKEIYNVNLKVPKTAEDISFLDYQILMANSAGMLGFEYVEEKRKNTAQIPGLGKIGYVSYDIKKKGRKPLVLRAYSYDHGNIVNSFNRVDLSGFTNTLTFYSPRTKKSLKIYPSNDLAFVKDCDLRCVLSCFYDALEKYPERERENLEKLISSKKEGWSYDNETEERKEFVEQKMIPDFKTFFNDPENYDNRAYRIMKGESKNENKNL